MGKKAKKGHLAAACVRKSLSLNGPKHTETEKERPGEDKEDSGKKVAEKAVSFSFFFWPSPRARLNFFTLPLPIVMERERPQRPRAKKNLDRCVL